LEKTEKKGYVVLFYEIKLMENEEGKVEVDKLDLGVCLIHVLYIILPCGFTKLLGVYKVDKEKNRINKLIVMNFEHAITFPIFFIYYEQDMAKSIVFFDYYNIYQGWFKRW
jgi:hypothetical protein